MTTWIFLRGLTREARHWGDFPDRFRAAFGGELADGDILTPDLPGSGRHHMEPCPSRVEAMMEACRRELRESGKTPPYNLLALSLGGMVAVAWAVHHPEECGAAVLLNTSLRPYCPFYERLRWGALPTFLNLLVASGEARERTILGLTSTRAAELGDVLPAWTTWAKECPVSRLNALRQLLAAARFVAPVTPTIPLLFLSGAGDRIADTRCSRRLARAWKADLAVHPTSGHDLPLDDGDWVASQVKDWLAGMDWRQHS